MSASIFTIDLARCTGCGACLIACKDRAGMPDDVDLLRIESIERGTFPFPEVTHRVVHCFHCVQAPCLDVCLVGAFGRSAAGLVTTDSAVCVGCGRCAEACPFGAITVLSDGTAVKCDGCPEEASRGAEPTCVRACPMRALRYTDAPASVPSGRIRDDDVRGQASAPRAAYLRREPSRREITGTSPASS